MPTLVTVRVFTSSGHCDTSFGISGRLWVFIPEKETRMAKEMHG